MSLALALLLAGSDVVAAAPPVPADHAADAIYDPAVMAQVRADLAREHGGMTHAMIGTELFELVPGSGRDGYRIEGNGWWGGDRNRAVIELRGEGDFGKRPDEAEVDLLYSRAVNPWFNLQAGLRQDIEPGRTSSLALGVKGLARWQIATEAMVFLSTRGDLLARLEASHEMRLTQRLLLVPRLELNLSSRAARDDHDIGDRSIELGLRLHYAFVPRFAPYLGVDWRDRFGTDRLGGDRKGGARFVTGVRFWF
ncbi:copper resistance protein B [Sphingomonas sp. MMS24-J13]|uniref:copper resistance protein B n=1 Tax=Sphingomonas sp. MMS24-J13 TaxID=3238686 RepID=UPI00384DA196